MKHTHSKVDNEIARLKKEGFRIHKFDNRIEVFNFAEERWMEFITDRMFLKWAEHAHNHLADKSIRKRLKDDEHRRARQIERDKLAQLKGTMNDEEVYEEDAYDVPPTPTSDIWKFD